MRILITGGSGFIGSYLIKYLLYKTDWDIVCIDKLSNVTKGWSRLTDNYAYYNPRLLCFSWDLSCPLSIGLIKELGDINIIIHLAAETHVDVSIKDPVMVLTNNILSTINMLEYARRLENLTMFQYFSTDEVFGPAPMDTLFKESDPHNPTNPYSASKAASEDICLSYRNTYNIPLLITNLMNVYGERQYSEKFIPMAIRKILNGEEIEIHTNKDGTPGSRCYIHVSNVVEAILFILQNGISGEKYNIKGECEIDNLTLAQKIADIMKKELKYKLINCSIARPGHDSRYSLDGSKLAQLGWQPKNKFNKMLKRTVKWTVENKQWLSLV